MRSIFRATVFGIASLVGALAAPRTAAACGGFFCNQAQPVNQAAEGIIFADNGDGTVTAVIQIKYQGPSEKFSWLLPISSVPKSDADIGIASDLAFQRLQAATNPNYSLTVRVEGSCRQEDFNGAPSVGSAGSSSSGGAGSAGPGGVKVEASGVVGAFEWATISVDQSTADPADAAVTWLGDNGYDVPKGAPKLLAPYLADGMFLLALKLTKGADAGSIRPIALTYAGTQPSIPMKLTAVAANDDMGVLAYVLGKSRSVPQNYYSLELNEARINWFNASSNYNQVVIEAANDAGGQGFVTEFAGASSTIKDLIWTSFDESNYTSFKTGLYPSFGTFFQAAYNLYGSWDGFWDATRAAVTLPANVAFDDFKLCPNCYADQLTFSPSGYLAELDKTVVQPVKLVQKLVDAHPQLTRLYSTLSADEMTLDPLFTFNADLPEVSNQHTAERVIECNPKVSQFEAPWRIELPQGGVIRGVGFPSGTWPTELGSLSPNRSIVRTSDTGMGKVIEDNSEVIGADLDAYNANVPRTPGAGSGSGGANGVGGGTSAGRGNGEVSNTSVSGGCNVGGTSSSVVGFGVLLALGVALARRRDAS